MRNEATSDQEEVRAMKNGAIITTHDLVNQFPIGGGAFTALKDINLSIEQGEFVGLVGPSGSGKTTLLNIIGALDKPTAGEVLFEDTDLAGLDASQLAEIRNTKIGFVFQLHHLLP